jgi:hypothetical protein
VFLNLEDNSVGSVFVDILAGTSEMNYFNLDRVFQETQLENAQLKKSLFNIAKNLGVKLPNKKPSITLVNISANIPAQNDSYNNSYLPVVKAGTQFTNGSVVFELLDDVDFSLDVSSQGIANRTIIPILNSFNEVIAYTITKQEIVYNGSTRVARRFVTNNEAIPFYQLVLPEDDIIDVKDSINSIVGFEDDEMNGFSGVNIEGNSVELGFGIVKSKKDINEDEIVSFEKRDINGKKVYFIYFDF